MAAVTGQGGGQLYSNDDKIQSQPSKQSNIRFSQRDTKILQDLTEVHKEIEAYEKTQRDAHTPKLTPTPGLEGHVTKTPAADKENAAQRANSTWARVKTKNPTTQGTSTFSLGQQRAQRARGAIPTEWTQQGKRPPHTPPSNESAQTATAEKPVRNSVESQNLESIKKFNSLDNKGQYILKVRRDENNDERIEFVKVDPLVLGTHRSKLKGSNPQEEAKDVARVLLQTVEQATPEEQTVLLAFLNHAQTAKMPSHEKNFDVRARTQFAELSSHLSADTLLPKGLSLQAAKSYFPTEVQNASLGDFLRGKGNIAYKKLTDTWAETATSTGLDVKCKANLNLPPNEMLKLIVDHLKTNKSAEFLDTGKAIKSGVESREGEKGSPVKDASSFTAAAFLLRVGPTLFGIDKDGIKAMHGIQRLANDYSLGKTLDPAAKELLDSLSVALTGSKPKESSI